MSAAPLTGLDLLWAFAINLGLGLIAFARGSVSRSGLVVGVVLGTLLACFGGWGAFAVLVGFFVFGTAATKLGYSRKASAGLAQEEGGRRGGRHALANCGTGLALAVTMPFWASLLPALGLVAAFATALSDTLGSEIGQLYGRRHLLATNFRPVPAGTEGAISLEGTLAGVLGSLLLALVGAGAGLYPWKLSGVPVVAAFVGTWVESLVGATWGREARIGNEAMNFMNTIVGAGVAIALGAVLAR